MARKKNKINKGEPSIPTKIRKRVDNELRRSEAYLAEAQRLTRTGNWVFNISSRHSFWSLEFFRIFDFDPARTKPSFSAFLERVHPEDRLVVEQAMDRGIREGHDLEHDYRLMLSDGLIKHIHAVVHPIAGRSGKIRDVIGTVADISDRIQAESELSRSAAYLVEAEKISHTGCWARNPRSGTLFWSQEEWRIFGLDPKTTKLSYATFLQMIHPEDRSHVEETSKRAVEEKKPYDIPFRIFLPDGSIKHIHSMGKPFFEASGDVVEYIGVSMDVTERKRDEAALQLAQAELARVARLTTIGELAASIAHEINQPLSAIVNNGHAAVNWLGHDIPNVPEVTEALKDIIKDANRASDVIGRIRALLKNDKPEYIALDINDVIREVLAITQTALQSRLVSVRSDLPAGLPPVLGDRVQLQQVIMNLIMNGADAMRSVTNGPRILRLVSRIANPAAWWSRSRTRAPASMRASWTVFSTPYLRPSPTVWGWGWPFADQSSKPMVAASGCCPVTPMAVSFSSLCRPLKRCLKPLRMEEIVPALKVRNVDSMTCPL
jgi:PAS domain S-box-containing protein